MSEGASTADSAAAKRKGGVFYGWWVVAAGIMANFAYAEQFNTSYGVFIYRLGEEMGWGRTALAGVQTVGRIPEAILASLLGPFVDRHGTRLLVAIGGVVVGGSFLALSTIDELWQLYLWKGIVMSAGAICLGGFVGVTVSNWFVVRRGRALGIINMGGFLATGIMPIAATFMIENWGWRQAWFVMGILVLLLALPAALVFRRRPEDLGMYPDGLAPEDTSIVPASARERKRREALAAADVPWTRGQALRTPVLWIAVFAWGLSSLAVTGTNLHLVPFMQDLGYPLLIAAAALSVRATSALIGSPTWGLLAERVPINIAASAQFACKAIAMLAFLFYPTPIGLFLGLVIYGIGVAGSQVVLEALLADYFGRTSLGLVRGIAYPLQLGFAASGPLVIGLLFDFFGSYQSAWIALFIGFLIAACLILFSRPPRRAVAELPAQP